MYFEWNLELSGGMKKREERRGMLVYKANVLETAKVGMGENWQAVRAVFEGDEGQMYESKASCFLEVSPSSTPW